MKFEELKQSLTTHIDACYNIFGQDEFMKDSALNQLKEKVVTSLPELNYTTFYSDELDEKKFFECMDSLPFLSEKKIIVLKVYSSKKLTFSDKLINYLKNIPPFCVFIIVSDVAFTLKGITFTTIDCTKISRNIIEKFILSTVKKHNSNIDNESLNLLIEYCDESMMYVNTELNKCLSYTNNITKTVIDELVDKHTEYKIFDFTNAIAKKENEKAIYLLKKFLSDKNSPPLIPVLYTHFRRLYFISATGKNDYDLAEELKINKFAVTKMREQLKFFKENDLKEILNMISDFDNKIKSGKIDDLSAIYSIVFYLIQK